MATLDALVYLSSRGGCSRDVKIVVFLRPVASGIAADKRVVDVGKLGCEKTVEVRAPLRIAGFDLTAPGSRVVDFLIFEDGLLTMKGQGRIGYAPQLTLESGGVPGDILRSLEVAFPSFNRAG